MPVYQLLGGQVPRPVRVYQNPGGRTPEELHDNTLSVIERYGYTALKIGPQPPGQHLMPWGKVLRESAARFEAVRRAVGDDIDIGLDPHAKIFEPSRALELINAVKPYRPYFVEEPIRPENIDALAMMKAKTDVTDRDRRVPLHEVRVPRPARQERRRHHPAGHLLLRRPARAEEDRLDGRGVLRHRRAAQPDGAGRDGGQRPVRGLHSELPRSSSTIPTTPGRARKC